MLGSLPFGFVSSFAFVSPSKKACQAQPSHRGRNPRFTASFPPTRSLPALRRGVSVGSWDGGNCPRCECRELKGFGWGKKRPRGGLCVVVASFPGVELRNSQGKMCHREPSSLPWNSALFYQDKGRFLWYSVTRGVTFGLKMDIKSPKSMSLSLSVNACSTWGQISKPDQNIVVNSRE